MHDLLIASMKGFGLAAGLIIAIGAQNAYVLAKGLRREHVLLVASIGALSDALLVAIGVSGVGTLVARTPWLTQLAAWGGAAFLFVYGASSFHRALNPGTLEGARGTSNQSWQAAALTMLAVTFLNPHVYLDTVVLLGSIAGQFQLNERWAFAIGAMSASFVWFYGLGYGAAALAPLFRAPMAWRVLDVLIGIVMWAIALSLVWGEWAEQ